MDLLLFLLFTIFLLAGISLHLNVTFSGKKQFDLLVRFFLTFVMFHVSHAFFVRLAPQEYAYIDRAAPFGLLYGPLLYFAFLTNQSVLTKKIIVIHGAPFIIGLICYLAYLCIPSFRQSSRQYYSVLYGLMALSWLIYPTVVYFKETSIKKRTANQQEDRTLVALVVLFTLSFFMLILIPTRIVHGEDASLSTGFLIFLAMFTTVLYVYIVNVRRLKSTLKNLDEDVAAMPEKEIEKTKESAYLKSVVQDEVMSVYFQKVQNYLDDGNYRNAKLSVDSLSAELRIPKHHLSQLFSQQYGESFTKHINTLRIQYACKILANPGYNSVIEELAEQCGFNSKASFYRNFKNELGMTPLEFLEESKVVS